MGTDRATPASSSTASSSTASSSTASSSPSTDPTPIGSVDDTPVIALRGLRKRFGPTVALDGLDLEVAPGEVHGFLGPNGAGKSTCLRILLGLLRADGGTAIVFGKDPWHDAESVHRLLAYVPGDVVLWPNLTGGETIDLLSRLHGGGNASRRKDLIQRFELDPTKRGRAYSKGNRQKVALVAALASDAPLLLLDEPTAGLDPLMEHAFQDELRRIRDEGRTVLLSSHILSEVEKACARVSIVRAGVIVDTGTLDDLRHLRRTHVRARLTAPVEAAVVREWPGAHDVAVDGTTVELAADPRDVGSLIGRLDGYGVLDVTATAPSLEEMFLAHYATTSTPPRRASGGAA